MLSFAEIPVGTGGGCGCARCAAAAAEPAPLAEIAPLLDAARARTDGVLLTGFEPFAHPDLPALIGHAVGAGYHRVGLRTDGGALSIPGNAAGVLHAGVRLFEFVVVAGQADHDALTGRRGLAEALSAGARALKTAAAEADARVATVARIPACKHNAALLGDAVAFAASLGCLAVTIDVSGWRAVDAAMVRAALDTATVNAVAGVVAGDVAGIPETYSRPLWSAS